MGLPSPGLTPEAKIAARRQLSIDLCGVALRNLVAKFPKLEAAVSEHGAARVTLVFSVEKWTPPANKRETQPAPRIRATVQVGKDRSIITLTGEQTALFLA